MPTTDEKLDAILALLQSGNQYIADPQQRGKLRIIKGDAYSENDRDLIVPMIPGAQWPTDLSDFAWTLESTTDLPLIGGSGLAFEVSVVVATGDGRSLRLSATSDTTATFATGTHRWAIVGAKSGSNWTVAKGVAVVDAPTT